MQTLSTGVRVVICAALSILLVKIVSDRQQIRWHPKKLPRPESPQQQTCPGVVLGPEPRLDWPNWMPFADVLAQEVAEADEGEASPDICIGLSWPRAYHDVKFPTQRLDTTTTLPRLC